MKVRYDSERLKGSITYNDDYERSKFNALLDYDGRVKKGMSMEELAELLICHEGYKFEINIYEEHEEL